MHDLDKMKMAAFSLESAAIFVCFNIRVRPGLFWFRLSDRVLSGQLYARAFQLLLDFRYIAWLEI